MGANRAEAAAKVGRRIVAVELSEEAVAAIDRATEMLAESQGSATKRQGHEWLIRQGALKLSVKTGRKKS